MGLKSIYYKQILISFVYDNKWLSENDGQFVPVQEVINECKDIIKMLTKVKNLYGGRY